MTRLRLAIGPDADRGAPLDLAGHALSMDELREFVRINEHVPDYETVGVVLSDTGLPYIGVTHPEPGCEWLGRNAVIRPASRHGLGVVVISERRHGDLEPDSFETELSRLAAILGLPVVQEPVRNV